MTRLDDIARYLTLADRVFQISDSDASDEVKYDLIFSDDLSRSLAEIFQLAYYDPDTSYADDIAAYVSALREKCADLQKVLGAASVSTADTEEVVSLARQVAAETSPTDSVGQLARLFARKIVRQHEELVLLRASKGNV
ncbi:MAG TPA: hypothetical protein VLE97_09035 [Gaiellaceae bacterium]|nr:hypothetical protein [Gaiellaceae bacterium]